MYQDCGRCTAAPLIIIMEEIMSAIQQLSTFACHRKQNADHLARDGNVSDSCLHEYFNKLRFHSLGCVKCHVLA